MESRTNGLGRGPIQVPKASETTPKPARQTAATALEVVDVVRHGMGRGSRVDLTILFAGHRVWLNGFPAKHVASSAESESRGGGGRGLAYFRFADRTWRKILTTAMEHARVGALARGRRDRGGDRG
jgi:hypothetical protein